MQDSNRVAADLGERFAAALAAKDVAELERILSPEIKLRGLTPSRLWEAQGLAEVRHVLFDNWFDDTDHIEELVSTETDRVGDRNRVAYRVRVHNDSGSCLVEQQAYFDVDGSRISWMSILCSGYRPAPEPMQTPDTEEP
jgi:hypothetical protein